jgi:hypothetical protein
MQNAPSAASGEWNWMMQAILVACFEIKAACMDNTTNHQNKQSSKCPKMSLNVPKCPMMKGWNRK